MKTEDVIADLREMADPTRLAGMQRYGIDTAHALGISMAAIRLYAKHIGKDHDLALALWDSGLHEVRILASMVAIPALVTEQQFDKWVADFYSWDLCDQVCGNLLDKTSFVLDKIKEYVKREEEYVKRAGFVLMATYCVHNKKAPDAVFLSFLPLIEKGADDDRNFVKKAANWALRQIGKRNAALLPKVIATAERILLQKTPSAKWIARDTLRELTNLKKE
ncbi:MAG: DNA alkylation repair protein [Taibaiella sp.]|nr:DNA alkylation repair protein [Taibaiella sp.]